MKLLAIRLHIHAQQASISMFHPLFSKTPNVAMTTSGICGNNNLKYLNDNFSNKLPNRFLHLGFQFPLALLYEAGAHSKETWHRLNESVDVHVILYVYFMIHISFGLISSQRPQNAQTATPNYKK